MFCRIPQGRLCFALLLVLLAPAISQQTDKHFPTNNITQAITTNQSNQAPASQQKASDPCRPFGTRLSLGEAYTDIAETTQIYVAFNTNHSCSNYIKANKHKYPCRQFQIVHKQPLTNSNNQTSSSSRIFTTYVHKCPIYGLQFHGAMILQMSYQIISAGVVDSQENGSYNFTMRVPNKYGDKEEFKVLAIGDWGLLTPNVTDKYYDIMPCLLTKVITDPKVTLFTFLGDMAYELVDDNCAEYERWINALEPIVSLIPMVVTPGNHDTDYSYDVYINSFFSPLWDRYRNYYYTFKIGSTQFLSYNPEFNVYPGLALHADNEITASALLKLVKNHSFTGTTRIVFSHYSMYCSDPNDKQCRNNSDAFNLLPFHEKFTEQSVDLYLGAHIHTYQRSYPINVENEVGSFDDRSPSRQKGVYNMPKDVVFISEGAGANKYFIYTEVQQAQNNYVRKNFTANIVVNAGYGILTLQKKNEEGKRSLFYQHFTGKDCSVADSLLILKQPTFPILLSQHQLAIGIVFVLLAGGCIFGFGGYKFYQYWKRTRIQTMTQEQIKGSNKNTGAQMEQEDQKQEQVEKFSQIISV